MKNISNKKAFTLIELLITISIISLLSTVVMYSTSEAKLKADDAHMKVESNSVATAVRLYKEDHNGEVPFSDTYYSSYKGQMINEDDPDADKKAAYQESMQVLVDEGYLPELPTSPSGSSYSYMFTEDKTDAVFVAALTYPSSNSNSNSCDVVGVDDDLFGSCDYINNSFNNTIQIPEEDYEGNLESLPQCSSSIFSPAVIPCRINEEVRDYNNSPTNCSEASYSNSEQCFDTSSNIINDNCDYLESTCNASSTNSNFPDQICSERVSHNGWLSGCTISSGGYYICELNETSVCSGSSNSDYCQCI